MGTADDILREVLKIQREKAAVKVAHISPAMKQALFAQLDAKLAQLEASIGSGVSNVVPSKK